MGTPHPAPGARVMAMAATDEAIPVPEITRRLRGLGSDTLAHETNLARAPMWYPAVRGPVAENPTTTQLWLAGHVFRQVAGPRLTVLDQRVFSDLLTRWALGGCEPSLRVTYSLGAAARAAGLVAGGKTSAQMRQALRRLRSVTIESGPLRLGKGTIVVEGWGLISHYHIVLGDHETPGERGWVELDPTVATLAEAENVTFLSAATWSEIGAADEIAARLWVLLESEDLTRPRRFRLFEGGEQPGELSALADLLGIGGWGRQRKVVERIRRAADVISSHDHRYQLTVGHSDRGRWNLAAARCKAAPALVLGGASAPVLPAAVAMAWRAASPGRDPSSKQRELLAAWSLLRGEDWVAAAMTAPDPIESVRAAITARETEIRRDEEAVAAMKQAERDGAAMVTERLRELGLWRSGLFGRAEGPTTGPTTRPTTRPQFELGRAPQTPRPAPLETQGRAPQTPGYAAPQTPGCPLNPGVNTPGGGDDDHVA